MQPKRSQGGNWNFSVLKIIKFRESEKMQGVNDDNQIPLKDTNDAPDKDVHDVEQNAGTTSNGNNRRNAK